MASILLASAGAVLGASIGGSILGVSAATIGGAVGSFAGSLVDSWIVSQLTPGQRIEGARLENLAVTTSTEGAVIPRVWGRMRLGGNIIWATDFTEHVSTSTQGGKGGGPKVRDFLTVTQGCPLSCRVSSPSARDDMPSRAKNRVANSIPKTAL